LLLPCYQCHARGAAHAGMTGNLPRIDRGPAGEVRPVSAPEVADWTANAGNERRWAECPAPGTPEPLTEWRKGSNLPSGRPYGKC
jgi:hypothetical protein